jgi:hypothetical protein
VKRTIVVFASLILLAAVPAFAPAAHALSTRKARIQACAEKNSGDPCTYTKKGEDVNGTCTANRRGKLMCTASSSGTEAPGGAMNAPGGAMNPPAAPAPGGDTGTPPPAGGGAMGSPGSESTNPPAP